MVGCHEDHTRTDGASWPDDNDDTNSLCEKDKVPYKFRGGSSSKLLYILGVLKSAIKLVDAFLLYYKYYRLNVCKHLNFSLKLRGMVCNFI